MRQLRIFVFLLVAISLVGCTAVTTNTGSSSSPFSSVGTVLDPPFVVRDFTLTNQSGKPTTLNDLRGKVSLVYLGYTQCTDVCPTAMAGYTRIKQAMGDAAAQANFVFISIDPEHDTPQALTQYLSVFDPAIIGLSGDLSVIQQIAQDVKTTFDPRVGTKSMDHSSRLYVLDKQGQVRITYTLDAAPQAIASDMRTLSAQ